MIKDQEKLRSLIEDSYQEAIGIRNRLHMYPELSCEEKETSRLVAETLRGMGIEVRDHIAGYGVIGTIYGRDRTRAVGIRADMDALRIEEKVQSEICSRNPGVMHACGHDMHTAILLASAKVLNEIRDELPISVRLIFQPNEEYTGGAKPMLDEGILDDLDVENIIGLHVDPYHDTGTLEFVPGVMNAALEDFIVNVHGKGCHGAHPNTGIDTIPCAASMVLAYQTLVSRRVDPTTPAVLTVGTFHSGTAENIISGETRLSGTIRALDSDVMDLITREFEEMTKSIARSYGCTADIEYLVGFPTLVNNEELLNTVTDILRDVMGKDKIFLTDNISMGGDDFAFFCHAAKGCYFNLGCRRPGDTGMYGLHSEFFDPDERSMLTGITAEVYSVLRIMGCI